MRWSVMGQIVPICDMRSKYLMRAKRFEMRISRSREARSSPVVAFAEFVFPEAQHSRASKLTRSRRSQNPPGPVDSCAYVAQMEHSKAPLRNSYRKVAPGFSH